jgi:CTP:molybdopterin cytidylyltransferase MocA
MYENSFYTSAYLEALERIVRAFTDYAAAVERGTAGHPINIRKYHTAAIAALQNYKDLIDSMGAM